MTIGEMSTRADAKSILYTIENSLFDFPERPGCWDGVEFSGLRAHATPEVSHLLGNLVGVSTLTESDADAVITQVKKFYGDRRHEVGWWLNPSSTPCDLVPRLESAGFSKAIELAGLVLTELGRTYSCNPRVTVRRAIEADREDIIRLYTTAYPMPGRFAEIWLDLIPSAGLGSSHYLAFLEGVESPVSVSSMLVPSGRSTVVMQGAATLSGYRRHGIYTAMMAARLADAHAMGKHAAVVQADRKTSAPICAKLGFVEVCSVDLYVWSCA